ncbi:MAG: VWA domain-containing protein [Planctomycetota bacterium]|nr:VWA domain-containing protein [Planctomycetota bacterium]
MTFLAPFAAAIAAAVFIPALVALYFLKLRRRIVEVSSTLLWRKAVQDMEVNAPLQRLRRNLLLLLQLLILLALLFALARPTYQQAGKAGQRMVILIDRSGSMNATDAAPTRLEAAKLAALKLVDDLPTTAPGGAMVVAFAQRTQVVQPFTTDAGLLRAAIRAIEPTDEPTRLEPALRLIEPVANQPDAPPLDLYLLSDGRVQAGTDFKIGNAQFHFVRIGGPALPTGTGLAATPVSAPASSASSAAAIPAPADNVGIVGLAARRDFRKPEAVQILVSLANFGSDRADLNLTLRVDGSPRHVIHTFIPAVSSSTGEPGTQSAQFELDLPGAANVEVSHDRPDMLPADDRAGLLIAEPRQLRVLLVSPGNGFLEQAIKAAGVRRVVAMQPGDYERRDPQLLRRGGWDPSPMGAEGFDVIVFDRFSPKSRPPIDALFFASTPPAPGLKILPPSSQSLGTQPVLDWRRDHALLRYVEMQDVTIESPGRLVLPDGAEVLATCQSGPVMGMMTIDNQRFVFTSFDLAQARTWPMQVSFPVFMSNTLPWLGLGGQGEAGRGFRPGETAVITASGSEVVYRGPTSLKAPVAQGRAVLPPFPRAGVYLADHSRVAPAWDRLPVNLLSLEESDIRPAPDVHVAGQAVAAVSAETTTRREVWRWFAWAALGVMLVEWLIYTRRMHI